jgi:predicted metal-binding protein
MEEILKKLMNVRCVSMHDCTKKCYGKGCDGSCPTFVIALMEAEELINNKK